MRPVGGVFEKAYGAKQAGIKTLIIPKENDKDIPNEHLGLVIHQVSTAEEAFQWIFDNYSADSLKANPDVEVVDIAFASQSAADDNQFKPWQIFDSSN